VSKYVGKMSFDSGRNW